MSTEPLSVVRVHYFRNVDLRVKKGEFTLIPNINTPDNLIWTISEEKKDGEIFAFFYDANKSNVKKQLKKERKGIHSIFVEAKDYIIESDNTYKNTKIKTKKGRTVIKEFKKLYVYVVPNEAPTVVISLR